MNAITNKSHLQKLNQIVDSLNATYDLHGGINHVDGTNLPSYDEMVLILNDLLQVLFPGFFCSDRLRRGNLRNWSGNKMDRIYHSLVIQVSKSIRFGNPQACEGDCEEKARDLVIKVLNEIPRIRAILKTDVAAAYKGDPASQSHEEIIIAYPGIFAVALYRVAHLFYGEGIPLLPRMISEFAHTKTGVDIHPGATIGESFFIDHATGVVIGETCKIGDYVRIYQHVTLGSLSFKKEKDGTLIKGLKRHPTIEDNVIVYAGCTILGGETVIGKNSVIGGNVWVTESVEPNTVISFNVKTSVYERFTKKTKDEDLGKFIKCCK